jgi:hypothetical protein
MSEGTAERWLRIPGHEGYEVSDLGRVRSVDRTIMRRDGKPKRCRGQILKPMVPEGYARVRLGGQWRSVHQLVLEAFVGPRPDGMQVCHVDGVSTNNHLENLRWGTVSENQLDRVRHGTHQETAKTCCRRGHPLRAPNLDERYLKHGRRICLACRRTHALRANRRKYGLPLPDFKPLSDAYYAEIVASEKVSRRVAQSLEARGKSGDQT